MKRNIIFIVACFIGLLAAVAYAQNVFYLNASSMTSSGTTFAGLATWPIQVNGTIVYCSDCTVSTVCVAGGTGALAERLNGGWNCGNNAVTGSVPDPLSLNRLIGIGVSPSITGFPGPESYIGFQSNQTGSGANFDVTNKSWQTYKLISAVTFDNCIASWPATWASCSPFPTMAIYDFTAAKIICAKTVDATGTAGVAVSLTNSTAAAGDVLGIVNDGAGAGCTASNGQMIAFGLAYHNQ